MTIRMHTDAHPEQRSTHVVRVLGAFVGALAIAIPLLGGHASAYDGTNADCAQWKKGTPQYAECAQENEQDRTDLPPVRMSGRLLNWNERDNLHSSASLDSTTAKTPHADPKGPSGRDKAEQIIERARQAARDAGQMPGDKR